MHLMRLKVVYVKSKSKANLAFVFMLMAKLGFSGTGVAQTGSCHKAKVPS